MSLTFHNICNVVPERHYIWNSELWKSLPQTLGIAKSELSRKFNVPRVTMWNWFENGNCEVRTLVDICNAYNIRVSAFITLNGEPNAVPKVYPVHDKPWHFKFQPEHLEQHFGENRMSWRKASEICGKARYTIRNWCTESMHIEDLVFMCNTFWINIGDVISDSTLPRLPKADMSYYEMKTELLMLRAELDKIKGYEQKQAEQFAVAEREEQLKKGE